MVSSSPAPVALAAVVGLLAPAPCAAQLTAQVFASGFAAPVAFVQDPSDPAVQYVVEQGGLIRVLRHGAVLPAPFLDLGAAITVGGERGLLGLALPPDYGASGRAYVNFTRAGDGHTVVARFARDPDDPLVAVPSSRFDLRWSTGLRYIEQPATNHNGGTLVFGPDGFLYIGLGDGGGANDPLHVAQSPDSLLGKMLRIDVAVPDSDPDGFVTPPDNPFLDGHPVAARPEIWAFGLRNPWKFSFDDPALGGAGALIIADVGQAGWEEINYEPAGASGRNYGWPNREGGHTHVLSPPVGFSPLTQPVFEYDHTEGGSVTGGYVYRGAALPAAFRGRYVFGDFSTGRVWSLGLDVRPEGEATARDLVEHTAELTVPGGLGLISAFGRDAAGELYVVSFSSGRIIRITAASTTSFVPPAPPVPGDINRDGHSDIAWRHATDGWVAAWLMQGTAVADSVLTVPARVADPAWRIVATPRLNADFKPDIVWQHRTEGWVAAWIMTEVNVMSSVLLGGGPVADTRWEIVASGDLDGDGKPDLVWRHREDGWLAAWLMDGTLLRDSVLLTPARLHDPAWRIVGTGDFNADGKADLVWWHDTQGWVAVWLMDGTTLLSSELLTPSRVPDVGWTVAGVGDFNGDGRPDLLWHHRTAGWVAAWLMNALTVADSVLLTPGRVPDVGWQPIVR